MKTFLVPLLLFFGSSCATDGGPTPSPPQGGMGGAGAGGSGVGSGGVGLGTGGSTGTACVVKAGIYTVNYSCGSEQYQAAWAVAKDLACPSNISGIPVPSGDLSALVTGKTFCSAIGSSGNSLVWTPDGAVGSLSLELNCSTGVGTTINFVLCGVTITH